MSMTEELRNAGRGREEWRVADPKDGSYCMVFSHYDGHTFNPEREAHEWLDDHRRRFPDSQFAGHEVRRVVARDRTDDLLHSAAEHIERLSARALELAAANDDMRGLLLWTLYHHQGGSSDIGQPIRRALGIGQHDHLTAEQIAEAKAAAAMPANAGIHRAAEGRPVE